MDAVVTSLMIRHLPEPDRPQAVAGLLRVLRPGGHLVIAEFQAPTGRLSRAVARYRLGPAMADNDLGAFGDLVVAARRRRRPAVGHARAVALPGPGPEAQPGLTEGVHAPQACAEQVSAGPRF